MPYPPQASAVPVTTSSAIQRPSGYPSESAVEAPSPTRKRQRMSSTPAAPTAARMLNVRVKSGPPIGCASLVIGTSPPVAEHHCAEERIERDGSGEALIDAVLHGLLDVGNGLLVVEAEAELLERYMREVEHLGAADLALAVHLRHVLAGVALEALVGFIEQVGVLAVDHRAARTDFAARRLFSFGDAMAAQLALDDLRSRLRPFELRDVERTDRFAVTAADAFGGVVRDDAVRSLLQRAEHA